MTHFDDFSCNFARYNAEEQGFSFYGLLAAQFIEHIKTLAAKPENLANFENYLSHHFPEWIKKHANTPEALVSEFREFAKMEV